MTWYFNISADKSQMDIYDHDGVLVSTIINDGSGYKTGKGGIMNDVLDVMLSEAQAEFQLNGFSPKVFKILRDAAFEQIEPGTPA